MARLLISVIEGRLVRDLFENGFLDMLTSHGVDVVIRSPGATYPPYHDRWSTEQVTMHDWLPPTQTAWQRRFHAIRKQLGTWFGPRGEWQWYSVEQRTTLRPCSSDQEFLDQVRPDLVLATHVLNFDEQLLVSAAQAAGIPTLGLVRSWDNVFKGLRTRPDELAVWNEINRNEVLTLERYRPEQVHITGPLQFDPYFDTSSHMTRAEFCKTLQLDPSRPIVTYATIGQYFPRFDETYLVNVLLGAIDSGDLPKETQVIVRLHPWSRLEQFETVARDPRIRLSYITEYVPGLSWMMDRNDVAWMGNLLKHSDAIVTPGSTITLEAAIFDTPTLVPLFHTTTPEFAEQYFSTYVMSQHFRKIKEEKLTAIDTDVGAFLENLRAALADRTWMSAERARLLAQYVPYRDGGSTRRLAELALARLGITANFTRTAEAAA